MHQPFDNFNRVGHAVSGIVSAVDPVRMAVKVLLQPENVESTWLPVGTIAAGSLRICRIPEMHEHVELLASRGDSEQLTVVTARFDTSVVPPVSPLTGNVAQPGEILFLAGGSGPPAEAGEIGAAPQTYLPWLHITGQEIGIGVDSTRIRITAAGVQIDSPAVRASGNLGSVSAYTGNFVDKNGRTFLFINGLCMGGA